MHNGKVTFKAYNMEPMSLLPPSPDELIPAQHLVRVLNRVVDELDIEPLQAKYKSLSRVWHCDNYAVLSRKPSSETSNTTWAFGNSCSVD